MKIHFPPKTIVAAVDNTAPSWAAFSAAESLASRLRARLETVYVEPILPAAEFEPSLDLAREVQRDVRTEIKSRVGPAAGLRVVKGQPAAELVRLCGPRTAQLMVMGTHGREGGDRFLFGSVAEAVFHRAKIPVLTIRAKTKFAPRRVLVPYNLEAYADEALRYAFAFSRALGAELTALFVSAEPRADDRLRALLEAALGEAPVRRLVLRGEARAVIAEEAKSGRHDLLVLSGHKRAQLSDLALGTTAERLLRTCRLPLLAVPAGAVDAAPTPATAVQEASR